MDAFTAGSAIITVIQAANGVLSVCYDYSAAAKNCPWELSRIIEETKSLRNVLESLQGLTERAKSADPAAKHDLVVLISLCEPQDGPLRTCLMELESLEKKLTPPGWAGEVGTKRRALVQALGWPLQERETKKILEKIGRSIRMLHMALGVDHMNLTLGIKQGVADVKQSFVSRRSEHQREKIHQWLAAPDPSVNHNEARRKRHATTGSWFISSQTYRNWKTKSNSFIWLHGIPGCGKTILTSSVIEDLVQNTRVNSSKVTIYFYFDFNDVGKQLHHNMLRSLILQLLDNLEGVPSALEQLFSSCMEGERQPTVDSLLEALRSLLEEFQEIFIVLDALDECTQRQDLLEDLEKLIAWEYLNSHIIVASRREKDIEERVGAFIKRPEQISILNAEVNEDIRTYISGRLQDDWKLKRYQNRPDIRQEILDTLMNKSDGMFRWAVCQLDALGSCINLIMLRKALASLPKTLDETYARVVCSIDEEHREDALKILKWLCYSARPLHVEELAEVVTVDIRENPRFDREKRLLEAEDILTICSSLITITKSATKDDAYGKRSGEQVRLAHFSVKEYLTSHRIRAGPASFYNIRAQGSNISIAETCLAYLLHFDSPSSLQTQTFEDFPLLVYAAQYWIRHTHDAVTDCESILALMGELFLSKHNAFVNWVRVFDPDKPWRKPNIKESLSARAEDFARPLYYASLGGLADAVTLLLKGQADVNTKGGLYGYALQAASVHGYNSIMRQLIDGGADINAQGGLYGNALQAASFTGHDNAVKLLLGNPNGANVNAQGGKYGNALYAASDKGHDSIIPLLLNAGADVNGTGGVYGNALQVAAFNGHEAVVRQLLDAGAVVDAEGGVYGNALQAASCNDNEQIIQQLLNAGSDPNSSGGVYGNALQGASFNGRDHVVQQLIDAGANVNAQGGVYGCALHAASFKGHDGVLELLLRAGANVNAPRGSYGTALYVATLSGHYSTVQMLLDAGAIVDANGGLYGTALDAASFAGHFEIAKLLLDNGAKVGGNGRFSGSALRTASYNGHLQVVELLLDAGADVNVSDRKHNSPLQAALQKGHDDVAKCLLQAGAVFNSQEAVSDVNMKSVPLGGETESVPENLGIGVPSEQFEISQGEVEDVTLDENLDLLVLPFTEVEANTKDANGQTPLQRAVTSGKETEVRLLVEHYRKHKIAIPTEDVALYSHIFCDDCGSRVPNWEAHYHCGICLDDDFDICFDCVDKGIHCRNESHKLFKRRFVSGKFIEIEDDAGAEV